MKNEKRTYLHNSEIIQIADGIVKQYYGRKVPQKVDVDAIAVKVLKQNVLYESFAESNPDKMGFTADGSSPLCIWKGGEVVNAVFPAETVVLDRYLLKPEMETRRRFALAHEISHIILSKTDPLHHVARFYSEQSNIEDYSIEELRGCLTYSELQANNMAGSILLMSDSLKLAVKKTFGANKVNSYGKRLFLPRDAEKLRKIAEAKGVSYTTLCIQLEACNLLNIGSIEAYLRLTGVTNGS